MAHEHNNLPNARELEREISEFLEKRFGSDAKLVSPVVLPEAEPEEDEGRPAGRPTTIAFDMKPEDLIDYLDQYIVKQDDAKAVLATKICTHFNRIRRARDTGMSAHPVGAIKNNILMLGPTGVGKTYMIKLIADRIGVPFVKGDATKFSETGYVGGDVEDLVRDLVREADDDVELAQYGIIYIDEIDKIAGSRHMLGADVSRTGVQRALLKPMEETEVELKVAHDPISMIQEIERYRDTGDRDSHRINTKHILFIMSGAFAGLDDIVSRRMSSHTIGFGGRGKSSVEPADRLRHVATEDLIAYGFESEFVGRLPVRAVFGALDAHDLHEILKNPNNPIIIGKKLDFAAYGISMVFSDNALQLIAEEASRENTGARGLVSAVERALLVYEKTLPSTRIRHMPVTRDAVENAYRGVTPAMGNETDSDRDADFSRLAAAEKKSTADYIGQNRDKLEHKHRFSLTQTRIDLAAEFVSRHITDIGTALAQVQRLYDDVKNLELSFLQKHDINIVLEEDAVDCIVSHHVRDNIALDTVYRQMTEDFSHGLKLVRQRTGRHRFFISRESLEKPEAYVGQMINQSPADDPPESPPATATDTRA
jgi:endopeptidase Clp ATP-binding regulatory subunit ClpX